VCTHTDDPAAVAATTTECDVDAQYPKESLCAAEAASERARVLGQRALSGAVGASTQKIGGGPGPGAALGHDVPTQAATGSGGMRCGPSAIAYLSTACGELDRILTLPWTNCCGRDAPRADEAGRAARRTACEVL
jgi:hypothetical protein